MVTDDPGSPRDRSLPPRIGRYRIVARIGRGAMGVVYSAVDEGSGRQVALKVLMADLEADPETRARFEREAQAAARLVHPNIITVHDAGQDGGRPFMAMQLLQGVSLTGYLKRQEAAPLERKLDLMIQICEGLAAAHARGIVHRDLKPNNLFVEPDGLLKILDFGVARFSDSSMTATGTMLGTPDYMSPEQARGAKVDARSDIFSAGAVFYFMLAGRKPFPGPDLPAILYQLQHHDVPAPPGVPPELSAIVLQALAKTPEQRPARVEQLLASLVRFRRQYQADTRRLLVRARTEFEEMEHLLRSFADADAALGLADVTPLEALARFREALPPMGNRAMAADSFDQAAVVRVCEDLEAGRTMFTALLEQRRAHAAALDRGEQLAAAGEAHRALPLAESVLAACPGSTRARALADAWRTQVPQQQPLAGLLEDLVQRALDSVDRASFDDAERALTDAEALQRDAPSVVAARRRLADARASIAAALRLATADAIRRARAVFRRGRYQEAIQELQAFVAREPAAQGAAAELERLTAFRRITAAAADVMRHRSEERLQAASTAARDGRLEEAVAAALEAATADPTSGQASQLLDILFRRQLDARIARERTRAREERAAACAPLLMVARNALARGYVGVAIETLQTARLVAPDHPDIDALLEQARQECDADDAETFDLDSAPWPDPRSNAPTAGPDDETGRGSAAKAPETAPDRHTV